MEWKRGNREGDHRDTMNTERRRRNPRSAAVSAEDQPLGPDSPPAPVGIRGVPGSNLLRLVLRAHRRAPGKILAVREDFAEL